MRRRFIDENKDDSKMMATRGGGEEEEEEGKMSVVSYGRILLPLLLVYISNQWSRSSLYYLVNFSDGADARNAMNIDIGFSESQYGALASVAFTALFAVASLVAGNVSDRSNRVVLTVGSAVAWSVATLATAASSSYTQVLLARIFMGLACAFSTPAAYTLVRDWVPSNRVALCNSIYGSGVYFGGALSSLSILLDERFGWRGATGFIAVYGFLCAALSGLVLPADPKLSSQTASAKKDDADVSKTNPSSSTGGLFPCFAVINTSPRVRWLFAASFVRFCSGLCIGVWAAPYFRRAYADNAATYAVLNALIVGVCGVASGLFGGYAADRAAIAYKSSTSTNNSFILGNDENAGRLLVPAVGSILAAPAWYMTLRSTTFGTSMTWLAIEYLVAECWFGPVVAVLQSSVNSAAPPGTNRGGTAQGLFTLTGAMANLAPSLLGILYGQMSGGGDDGTSTLSMLLGVGVSAGYILSALFFAMSARASTTMETKTS